MGKQTERTPKGVAQVNRMTTTIRMSNDLAEIVDDLCVGAGVSKNAFFVMAIAREAVTLGRVKGGKAVLKKLEREFNKELSEAKEALG